MRYKRTAKEILMRLDEGEEIASAVLEICKKEKVESASIFAIGAVKKAELAHFDTKKMEYHSKVFKGMYEIASLIGNIAMADGGPVLHAHMAIADKEYHTFGGHLKEATVDPTCEIMMFLLDSKATREKDARTGLKLQRF